MLRYHWVDISARKGCRASTSPTNSSGASCFAEWLPCQLLANQNCLHASTSSTLGSPTLSSCQASRYPIYILIWLVCLFVWVSVCFLYPIKFKSAEPIGPKFFVGNHVTTEKVYEWQKFKKNVFYRFLTL